MDNNILIPRNIEGRKEKLRQHNIQLISQEVIEGDLNIDETFLDIPEDFIKVKEIKGDVRLTINKGYIPSWLKDVKIYGNFSCSYNNLTSLENCPQYVGGSFFNHGNKLTSLKGCPKYIGDSLFYYQYNKILELPEGVKLKGRIFNG